MPKKTYRIKPFINEGDNTTYRTDGIPILCCSFQTDYLIWGRSTKFNNYNGYSGYISESLLSDSLKSFNPDNLKI